MSIAVQGGGDKHTARDSRVAGEACSRAAISSVPGLVYALATLNVNTHTSV